MSGQGNVTKIISQFQALPLESVVIMQRWGGGVVGGGGGEIQAILNDSTNTTEIPFSVQSPWVSSFCTFKGSFDTL